MAISPQASALEPALQQALHHHRAGRPGEAEKIYREILQARPDDPGVGNALAIALKDQGRLQEAEELLRRIIALVPDYAAGHSNLGNILFVQGRLAEAETCYRRALALRPNMPDALKNLGLVILERGRFGESVPWFRRHAELVYAPANAAANQSSVPEHKARHDQEQRDYLKEVMGGAPAFHLEEGGRVAPRAVKPDRSRGEVAAQWAQSSPQIAVIDDLLTQEALEGLRRFCLRSTIWHRVFPNGYLGAMPEHGFACALLAQIDEELRATYPSILGQDPLLRCWGFKYDSRLGGINLHADFAEVNVNFWITPDEANLDPDRGGLIIWDTPAPLDWTFAQYNGAGQPVRDFLDQAGAKSVTVPYRANRAVVFDSDLFHETDRIVFKDGYLNRRVNITMLYGERGSRSS